MKAKTPKPKVMPPQFDDELQGFSYTKTIHEDALGWDVSISIRGAKIAAVQSRTGNDSVVIRCSVKHGAYSRAVNIIEQSLYRLKLNERLFLHPPGKRTNTFQKPA